MKASAGDRAYMQSLISLALSLCRIFPIDDSIGDSLLGFPDRHYFLASRISSLTVLMSPLVALLVFIYFEFFLLNTISQYSLEGHLKITLLLYSQTLPFLKPFLENFLKKIKSL